MKQFRLFAAMATTFVIGAIVNHDSQTMTTGSSVAAQKSDFIVSRMEFGNPIYHTVSPEVEKDSIWNALQSSFQKFPRQSTSGFAFSDEFPF